MLRRKRKAGALVSQCRSAGDKNGAQHVCCIGMQAECTERVYQLYRVYRKCMKRVCIERVYQENMPRMHREYIERICRESTERVYTECVPRKLGSDRTCSLFACKPNFFSSKSTALNTPLRYHRVTFRWKVPNLTILEFAKNFIRKNSFAHRYESDSMNQTWWIRWWLRRLVSTEFT